MEKTSKRKFNFLPLSIRLETLGGVATPLVLRGTPLPTKRSDVFSTAADNQVSVEVKLLLGESPLAKNNVEIGTFHLNNIPAATKGKAQIDVEFSVDPHCSVTARANLQGAPLSAEQTFAPPHEVSEQFIAKMLAGAEATRATDEAELSRIEATSRARSLVEQAEEVMRKGSDPKLSAAIAAVGLALASGDSDDIREKTDALALHLQTLTDPFINFFGTLTARRTKPHASSRTAEVSAVPKEGLAAPSPQSSLGRIFGGGTFTLDPQLCFVLMPFAEKFQPLYDDHIRPTIVRAGLRSERADEIRGATLITWDVWQRINRARLLVAELTDQNANVFYELGLAHALGKDVILITQSMNFVPFDLQTIRCIVYEFTPRGTQKLEEKLAATLDALMKSG